MIHFSFKGINVLTLKEQKRARGAYYTHLVTVALISLTIVFGAGSLFLLPSYFLARDHTAASERFRDAVAGTIDLKEAGDIEQNASRLNERIRIGNEFENALTWEAFIGALAEVPLRDVILTDISLTRKEVGVAVRLAGVSETRESLLVFTEALKTNGSFASIKLPVSQLVSGEDISFSIEADFVKK